MKINKLFAFAFIFLVVALAAAGMSLLPGNTLIWLTLSSFIIAAVAYAADIFRR